jgi:hypothetical protein
MRSITPEGMVLIGVILIVFMAIWAISLVLLTLF